MFGSQRIIHELQQQQLQLLHEAAAARQSYQAAQSAVVSERKKLLDGMHQCKKTLLDNIAAIQNEEDDLKNVPADSLQLQTMVEDFKKSQLIRQKNVADKEKSWLHAKEKARNTLPDIQGAIKKEEQSLLKEMFIFWRAQKSILPKLRDEQEKKLLNLNQNKLQKDAFVLWRQKYAERAAFFLAISQGNVEQAELLLKSEIDINGSNKAGYTPLILAIVKDQLEMVQWLLECHANPNQTCSITVGDEKLNDITPLLIAMKNPSKNTKQIVELLLSYGAKMNFRPSSQPYAPLHAACLFSTKEVVQTLLDNRANSIVLDAQNRTASEVITQEAYEKLKDLKNLFPKPAKTTQACIKSLKN